MQKQKGERNRLTDVRAEAEASRWLRYLGIHGLLLTGLLFRQLLQLQLKRCNYCAVSFGNQIGSREDAMGSVIEDRHLDEVDLRHWRQRHHQTNCVCDQASHEQQIYYI